MKPIDKQEADRPGAEQCEPGDNKPAVTNAVHAVRHGLSGRPVIGDRLAGRARSAAPRAIVVGQLDRPRRGEGLLQRLGGWRADRKSICAAATTRPVATFSEIASFKPFDDASGVSVATTSTTTGADLLVSGVSPADKSVQVLKFELVRPDPDADQA